ncbi:serine/threonine-protein kinase [Streptomyces sp. NPDC052225]|uniref:serine/threonine-protein kinase n=1 Tax=Streptomyces sp. NPDC052225 TaxID=3154949 RepID=UPI003445C6BC
MVTPSAELFQPLGADDPPVVGGYRLAAVLGTGGMGKVYLSYTPGGRPIALKVIRPEFSQDPEFRRRFEQEVSSAQRVQGLYTAPVIDGDTKGQQPWLATAYVPGPSLAHAVAQHGALPLRSTLLLTVGVAEALHVIHGAGIVHRDLKPANVLLAADGPRVIDFGIARAADATSLTGTGVSVGTPHFMAPEQAAAGTITPATDVFALGQIAAFAAIGKPAFGEGSSHAVLYRIVHEDPDLSQLPDELRPLVTHCLSRDPADRPSLTEIITKCHELSPTPLRQGEDWLPQTFASSITERLRLPEPAPTPAPAASAPTPPVGAAPTPPPPTAAATPAPPLGAPPHVPTAFSPHTPPPSPYAHTAPHPSVQARAPYPTPAPAPQWNRGYAPPQGPGMHGPRPWPTPPPPKKRTGLIVAGVVVGVFAALAIIGALVPDEGSGDGQAGSSNSSSSGGSAKGGGSGKLPDPKPATYKGIDLTEDYYLQLADNPPKPIDGGDTGAMYMHGDLYYYYYGGDSADDQQIGTDNGKLVLLNNAQQGSLKTCRAETRYTEKIVLAQLTAGSEICVRSDSGHIAVVTYRGRSGVNDPSKYVTLDVTVWRNAEEPTDGD